MNALTSKPLSRLLLALVSLSVAACGLEVEPGAARPAPTSGFAYLIAQDPLRHTYDFKRADYGAVVQDNTVKNAGSHLDYSSYVENELAVGIQGGEAGTLVDLGTDEELAAKLGVEETVGSGQGFAHLELVAGRFSVAEANAALDATPDQTGHLEPQVGHVYLARIVDVHSGQDLVAKMLVVHLEAGAEVALEWEKLR